MSPFVICYLSLAFSGLALPQTEGLRSRDTFPLVPTARACYTCRSWAAAALLGSILGLGSGTLSYGACRLSRRSFGPAVLFVRPITKRHHYIPRVELLCPRSHNPWLVAGLEDSEHLSFSFLGPSRLESRRVHVLPTRTHERLQSRRDLAVCTCTR